MRITIFLFFCMFYNAVAHESVGSYGDYMVKALFVAFMFCFMQDIKELLRRD